MANIEQKRAYLEKALRAIGEDEMEAVAGGLSKNAKLALQIGGSVATILLNGAAVGAAAYFGTKFGAKSAVDAAFDTAEEDRKPIPYNPNDPNDQDATIIEVS